MLRYNLFIRLEYYRAPKLDSDENNIKCHLRRKKYVEGGRDKYQLSSEGGSRESCKEN